MAKARSTAPPKPERWTSEVFRICEQRAGASVTASMYDRATATQRATPNWRKNRPTTPRMKTTGTKIAMTAAVAASAANVIWAVPSRAARTRSFPPSACRKMFSITMIASSTTMPTASARASSVNVFRVKPRKKITATVPRSDIGIARTTFSVEERDPRNIQQTRAVSRTERTSSNWISWTDSSMNVVESKLIPISIPSGSVFWICAISALIALATATALAPRCLRIPRPWAGAPLTRAIRRTSSKPSSTRATSSRWTGAPFLSVTTSRLSVSMSSASPRTRTFTSRPSTSRRPAGSSRCWRLRAAIRSVTPSPCAFSWSASTQILTLRSR